MLIATAQHRCQEIWPSKDVMKMKKEYTHLHKRSTQAPFLFKKKEEKSERHNATDDKQGHALIQLGC